jgi:hypothetical protein
LHNAENLTVAGCHRKHVTPRFDNNPCGRAGLNIVNGGAMNQDAHSIQGRRRHRPWLQSANSIVNRARR